MYLKSLTLSGFKSFGKTTVFDFQSSVTAIVGPNGSGKSNVAEALRWVLGEQSMKSLRGKKGEDLIFNGSDSASRLSRAEVKLIFDNSHKQFPYEFDEVIVSRRVMRDGTNEYALNGSAVRLKDIFELLSTVGLGSTQHHIISQGEVDRILWASQWERQEMIEEALGLKEYHLKIRDAERKLTETKTNVKEVEARKRELTPHLKYLRDQAEKMKAHEHFAEELEAKVYEYVSREERSLSQLEGSYANIRKPLEQNRKLKEGAIEELQKKIKELEGDFSHVKAQKQEIGDLAELEEKARALTRDLGRVEGELAARASQPQTDFDAVIIMRELKEMVAFVDELAAKDSFESIRSGLKDIRNRLQQLVKGNAKGEAGAPDLAARKKILQEELRVVQSELGKLQIKKEEDASVREDIVFELREHERELREHERELEKAREKLREIAFEEERYKVRRGELKTFMTDMKVDASRLDRKAEPFAVDADRVTLLRAVERLRIKLEEAGGIDASVIKEYEDTKTRTEFLANELTDLERAHASLEHLSRELKEKLREKFNEGLTEINDEFILLFKKIFGGGKAALHYIKPKTNEETGEEDRGGVDIALDIPRKRLRNLDMLSGGERALTSVALLFAMSAVNPPPFLVLDETDAALDEANSQRYGDLLEELSKKTQLIVITHNRQTMSRAGVLYGVTLGGDGISRLLSLKFEEATEYAKEG